MRQRSGAKHAAWWQNVLWPMITEPCDDAARELVRRYGPMVEVVERELQRML
jgi:hypothetical protein